MFLSKKVATSNKGKPEPVKPKRMLGGWEDEEEVKPVPKTTIAQQASSNIDLLDNSPVKYTTQSVTLTANDAVTPPSSSPPLNAYFDWDTLNERTDIPIEKNLVEQMVKPSGIRIKQADSLLQDFLKEVKFLETSVIGSLLMSKLEVNYPFEIKAKALYAIEFLSKKNADYLGYFKGQSERLRDFPEPEDNVENYRKILKSVMNVLGTPLGGEEEKRQFVDPGYNTEETRNNTALGNFFQENAGKTKKGETGKALVGPGGQQKPKSESKILQVKTQSKKEVNLLQFQQLSLV